MIFLGEKKKRSISGVFDFHMARRAEKTKTKMENFRDFCFCFSPPIRNGLKTRSNFSQHTSYVCGDNSNEDTVINQFPLCKNCSDNKWPNKSFTIIAKRKSNKKAKINNSDDNNEIIIMLNWICL